METTEKLWREFSGRLRAFILKSIRSETEADDLLQEVFAKIHAGIGQLKDPAALEPWLFQITRNAMVDSLRQRRDVPGSTDSLPARSDEPIGSQLQSGDRLLPQILHRLPAGKISNSPSPRRTSRFDAEGDGETTGPFTVGGKIQNSAGTGTIEETTHGML